MTTTELRALTANGRPFRINHEIEDCLIRLEHQMYEGRDRSPSRDRSAIEDYIAEEVAHAKEIGVRLAEQTILALTARVEALEAFAKECDNVYDFMPDRKLTVWEAARAALNAKDVT